MGILKAAIPKTANTNIYRLLYLLRIGHLLLADAVELERHRDTGAVHYSITSTEFVSHLIERRLHFFVSYYLNCIEETMNCDQKLARCTRTADTYEYYCFEKPGRI